MSLPRWMRELQTNPRVRIEFEKDIETRIAERISQTRNAIQRGLSGIAEEARTQELESILMEFRAEEKERIDATYRQERIRS